MERERDRERERERERQREMEGVWVKERGSGERGRGGGGVLWDARVGQSGIWVLKVVGTACRCADAGGHLREGQREVEALPQAAEHDERTGREGASRHFAALTLEGAAHRALAAKAAVGSVGAGAPVAADAGHAASGLRV